MKKKRILKSERNAVNAVDSSVKPRLLYLIIVFFWSLYVYFTFSAPASNILQISPILLIIIRISIAIPYLLIWLAAGFSFIQIKQYALSLRPSRESFAFDIIATGILLLLASLILSTTFSSVRSFYAGNEFIRPLLTVITNYMYVFPYLTAFALFLYGANELNQLVANNKISFTKYFIYGIPLLLFAYIWLELIFSNENRVLAPNPDIGASYYLKDSLLILTIVIPSLVTWFMGFLAFLKMRIYYQHVKGYIYRRALIFFISGLASIIFASIFLQALLSLGPGRLLLLGLNNLLIIIYLFVFMQVIGFFLVAKGSGKLTKIETV